MVWRRHVWPSKSALERPHHDHPRRRTGMNTYLCIICGFVYSETDGRPEDGIAPGTLWADVPADWACPECGVGKSDFEMVAI
jgi:rubredoxin